MQTFDMYPYSQATVQADVHIGELTSSMTFLFLIEQYSGNAKLKKLEWNDQRKPVNLNINNNEYIIRTCLLCKPRCHVLRIICCVTRGQVLFWEISGRSSLQASRNSVTMPNLISKMVKNVIPILLGLNNTADMTCRISSNESVSISERKNDVLYLKTLESRE